ncbi:hypothetical protein L1049_002727 [Liquidambar formosana]|uniref:Phytocyanin domain-containing protein n=1 Tax=Liquidambar formosana TaxID=63359 RepID=A0AAP0R9D6_LIQFO
MSKYFGGLVLVMLVLFSAQSCLAKVYTVGDSEGWGPKKVNYFDWANSKKFFTGDILEFNYAKGHTVAEVDNYGFVTCNATNPIFSDDSGHTSITLNTSREYFFISAGPRDCDFGMWFAVYVK